MLLRISRLRTKARETRGEDHGGGASFNVCFLLTDCRPCMKLVLGYNKLSVSITITLPVQQHNPDTLCTPRKSLDGRETSCKPKLSLAGQFMSVTFLHTVFHYIVSLCMFTHFGRVPVYHGLLVRTGKDSECLSWFPFSSLPRERLGCLVPLHDWLPLVPESLLLL